MAADLLYSETERDLAAALSDLLAAAAAPADVLARTEQPETYDAKLWRTVAAEIGIAGLLIPEPLGGAGASYRELAAAAEQFGAAVAPIPYLGSAAVATAALLSAARSAAAARNRLGRPGTRRPVAIGRGTVRPGRGRPRRRPPRPGAGRLGRGRAGRPGIARRRSAAPAGRRLADRRARGDRHRRAPRPVPGRGPGQRARPGRPGWAARARGQSNCAAWSRRSPTRSRPGRCWFRPRACRTGSTWSMRPRRGCTAVRSSRWT